MDVTTGELQSVCIQLSQMDLVQARPQVHEYGTGTGGGCKGRSPVKDRAQSSNQGPLIC